MSEHTVEPFGRPVHHYGYVVAALEAAVDRVVRALGAGPFFRMDHVALDTVTSEGEPAVFDHSSAFGVCGPVFIELMEIHRGDPEAVRARLDVSPVGLHHIAWVVPDWSATTSGLDHSGMAAWLDATLGDIHFAYHDATATLGHHVEIHDDSPGFQGFFAMMRAAGEDWDGREPLRPLPG
jgi:Glyoxalase/Bleomycin resistance protein/Dioxygenase superfamily